MENNGIRANPTYQFIKGISISSNSKKIPIIGCLGHKIIFNFCSISSECALCIGFSLWMANKRKETIDWTEISQ